MCLFKKLNKFEKFEKIKNKKKMFTIDACFYVRPNGDFVAYTNGEKYDMKNHVLGNINNCSDTEICNLIFKMFQDKIDGKIADVEKVGGKDDYIYNWEKDDYKLDKCESVKHITVAIRNTYPNCVVIVDSVCVGRHAWGGGKYVHIIETKDAEQNVVNKLKAVINFKPGHMPGSSEEEKKKYRAIVKCKNNRIVCEKKK